MLRAGDRNFPTVLVGLGQQGCDLALGLRRVRGGGMHLAHRSEIHPACIVSEAGRQLLKLIDVIARRTPQMPARASEKDRWRSKEQRTEAQQAALTQSPARRHRDGWVVHRQVERIEKSCGRLDVSP